MKRNERRVFELGDEIDALVRAERLASEELIYHEHLDDDAQRDAAVSNNPIDRSDARETASDVARFERHLDQLRAKKTKLEAKRFKLIKKLAD